MNQFVVYKKDDQWQTEHKNGQSVKQMMHNSRRTAIESIFIRARGIDTFRLVVPEVDGLTAHKDGKFWYLDNRRYYSRVRAIIGYLSRHPGIIMFYVVVPEFSEVK